MAEEIKKAFLNDITKTDKSLPTDEVLITQEGEARLIPSGLISKIGKDGDSAYQVAVSNGFKGSQSEWLESLKGKKGDPGKDGNPGTDGKNFEIHGIVNKITDLPDATTVKDQIWLTNEFGHLHFAKGDNATDWIDWGQFTGVKGDKGDPGKDADHSLPLGGNPGDVLSKAPNGDLEWSSRRKGYIKQDFDIPNIGNKHTVLGAFDGLCDILFERTTSIMARITVTFKKSQHVNMFYSAQRLNLLEQRQLDKTVSINENWLIDPDLICNVLGEIPILIYLNGSEVNEMHIRAGNNGKIKIWFDKIE